MIYLVPQCRHFKCLLPATGREITIDCKHKQGFTALKKASAFYRTSNGKTNKSFTSNSNEAEEDSRKPKWLNDNATRRDPDRRDNEKYSAFGTATMMSSTRDPGIAVMTGPRNLRIVLLKHDSHSCLHVYDHLLQIY